MPMDGEFPKNKLWSAFLIRILTLKQHEKLQALVASAFASDHQPGKGEEQNPTPRTLSISTRLMWDILLYNLAANRGPTTLPQFGGLFDASSFCPEDSIDEGEDIVELEVSHSPTIEVVLSNGQALPPQSGKRRNLVNIAHANRAHAGIHSPVPATPMADLDAHFAQSTSAAPWPMAGSTLTLDMAYDSFFQPQVPGSPFFGTWEVGNL